MAAPVRVVIADAAAETDELAAVVSEGAGARTLTEQLDEDMSILDRALAAPAFAIKNAALGVFSNESPPASLNDLVGKIAPRQQPQRVDKTKTTGHIREMPQRNLKEQLVEGGYRVLFERGFHAASVNDIVAAAHVPKGSFYNHFASKEALALEVTRRYAASYDLAQLRRPGDPPLQRLREHFEATIERTVERGIELGCLLGNFSTELATHSPAVREQVDASFAEWSDAVAAALEEAQADGQLDSATDVHALGRYLVDAYEGAVARAKVTGRREPLDAFVETTFGTVLPD